MLATVPPLWRDQDAYNQLTLSPPVATFQGHAPLYSLAVRVPLFAGYKLERRRGIAPPLRESFYLHPCLTDTGIFFLILLQHAALAGAALGLLLTVSVRFWVRLLLAIFWSNNALFYTFAHCVGSETLSMIAVLVLATIGLRIIRDKDETSWSSWYLVALLLWLCLLTRHANQVLALILPLAFLLAALLKRAGSRPMAARDLRQAVIALAIGISCIGVAQKSAREVCRSAKLRYHSRIGFTFLWRLQFLNALPRQAQTTLLDEVAARTNSQEAQKLISLFRQILAEGSDLRVGTLVPRARAALFPSGVKMNSVRLDAALNQRAWAFLMPPVSPHWRAAKTDFATARRMPLAEAPAFLFATTAYYFAHREDMPECANLATYRDYTAEQLTAIPSQHRYFRLWNGISYNQCFIAWLGAGLILFVFRKRSGPDWAAIVSYGIVLTGIGLAMMGLTCLIGELLPRYTLPMWELLLISCMIYFGAICDVSARKISL